MIGKELKALRNEKNLSQAELAKIAEVTQAEISLWENNKNIPAIDKCIKIADFFEITLDELVDRKIKPNWEKNK